MKPEKQQLLHELLEGGSRNENTLFVAGKILRRRRQWRAGRKIFVLVTTLAMVFLLAGQKHAGPARGRVPPQEAKLSAPPQARSLTDDELLALFPNTPVGLATLPTGKKVLLFLRPADEARYVIHL
jgi:hypothetical protein